MTADHGGRTLRRIRVGLVLLNLLAVLACVSALRWRWHDTIELSKLQAASTAGLLARGADATLDKVALTLANVQDQVAQRLASGDLPPALVWPLIDTATGRVPELQTIGLFDATGQQICGVPADRCRALNAADRDYFAAYKADPAKPPALFGPVTSRFDGKPALVMAAALRRPDGQFFGVAVGLLPLDRLSVLVNTATQGPNGIASLRTADRLELLARMPALPSDQQAAQVSALSRQLKDVLQAAPETGVVRLQSSVDGRMRVNAYQRLRGYPVYAFVGDAEDDALAEWNSTVVWCAGGLVAFAVLSILMERLATRGRRVAQDAQRLYDEAPVGYHTLDAQGHFRSINATELQWLESSRSDVIGKKKPTDFFTDAGRATFAASYPALKAGQPVEGLEFDLVAPSGTVRRVAVSAVPVLDAQGQFKLSNSVMYDITALHAVRQQLQLQNAQQAAMLDTDLVGIVIVQDGKIVWKNAGMDLIFGYAGGEWTDLPIDRFYRGREAFAVTRDQLDQMLDAQGSVRRQVQLKRKDGSLVWADLFAVRIGPQRTFGVITDITSLKAAEAARLNLATLQAQNQSLVEAARIKDLFLANMSHELRTPLNGVLGFAELLQMKSVADDEAKRTRFARQIGESGRHLLALVNSMLEAAKAESGKIVFEPLPIVVRQALDEVEAMLLPKLQSAGMTMGVEVEQGLHEVINDPLRLRQMLLNLADNAVKFSPKGGQVWLRARMGDGATWCVDVEDQGIGIAPDDLGRLFQSFAQLSEGNTKRFGGAGLGLALVRQIARAQGGEVAVRSALGVGSVFTLTLPLRIDAERADGPA